jgi:glycosyltransferase involved in cell wall biosynthesis
MGHIAKTFQKYQDEFQYHGNVANELLPSLLEHFDVCVAFTQVGQSCGGGGTSNALLEQMAAGRVIVAWDNPHFRQILDDSCAYIVAQNDVPGVIEVLQEILKDSREAMFRASNGSKRVQRYSLDDQVERCSNLLNSRFFIGGAHLAGSNTGYGAPNEDHT